MDCQHKNCDRCHIERLEATVIGICSGRDELLAAARAVISANENKIPGKSREQAEREALVALIKVCDKHPHPCAAKDG